MSSRERSDQILGGRRRFLRTGFVGAGLLGAHELSIHSADAFCWHKRRRVVACTPAPAPVYVPQAGPVPQVHPSSQAPTPLTTGLCKSEWCPQTFITRVGNFWMYTAVFCDPNGDPTSQTRGMTLSSEAATPLGCSPSNCDSCQVDFLTPRVPADQTANAPWPKIPPQDQIFGMRMGKHLPEIGTPLDLPASEVVAKVTAPCCALTTYSNYLIDVRGQREIRLYLIYVTPPLPGAKPFVIATGEQVRPHSDGTVPMLDASRYMMSATKYLVWVTPPGSTYTFNVLLAQD